MERQDMIKTLVRSNFMGTAPSKEEVASYISYLQGKSDLELQNMLVINCF